MDLYVLLGTIIAAILGGGALWLGGKKTGEKQTKIERAEQENKAIRDSITERENVEKETRELPPGSAADELRKRWSRD